MARKRKRSAAPKRVRGLPKQGRLYSASARKTAQAMMKQYGSKRGKQIFYALANKRAGKGRKGKDRMHLVANKAFRRR